MGIKNLRDRGWLANPEQDKKLSMIYLLNKVNIHITSNTEEILIIIYLLISSGYCYHFISSSLKDHSLALMIFSILSGWFLTPLIVFMNILYWLFTYQLPF